MPLVSQYHRQHNKRILIRRIKTFRGWTKYIKRNAKHKRPTLSTYTTDETKRVNNIKKNMSWERHVLLWSTTKMSRAFVGRPTEGTISKCSGFRGCRFLHYSLLNHWAPPPCIAICSLLSLPTALSLSYNVEDLSWGSIPPKLRRVD